MCPRVLLTFPWPPHIWREYCEELPGFLMYNHLSEEAICQCEHFFSSNKIGVHFICCQSHYHLDKHKWSFHLLLILVFKKWWWCSQKPQGHHAMPWATHGIYLVVCTVPSCWCGYDWGLMGMGRPGKQNHPSIQVQEQAPLLSGVKEPQMSRKKYTFFFLPPSLPIQQVMMKYPSPGSQHKWELIHLANTWFGDNLVWGWRQKKCVCSVLW